MVAAGLRAIYLSGWQVAADANTAAQTYPDQSLYPADSVPKIVERINNVRTFRFLLVLMLTCCGSGFLSALCWGLPRRCWVFCAQCALG